MKRDMRLWLEDLCKAQVKKAMPILSFPAIQLMGVTVSELISDSGLQARAMELVAERTDPAASVSPMDLSVEAECFGSKIKMTGWEAPAVTGSVVSTEEDAKALIVPKIGSCRTGICIDAVRKASGSITDRPVLAGVIGPYSLAARLIGVTEIMMDCYDEPELVNTVLEKAASFLIDYCRAFKEAGANGVMMAEPVTGLLSPEMADEFSAPYVKRIVDAVQDDGFLVIYHNCGGSVLAMMDSILSTGSAAYHFGNAIDMREALLSVPKDVVIMGNLDPVGDLKDGTPESVRAAVLGLLESCGGYGNFILSSGCDIPPLTPWENIEAFFQASKEYYTR